MATIKETLLDLYPYKNEVDIVVEDKKLMPLEIKYGKLKVSLPS